MDAETRELLKQEAVRSLRSYLATGIRGFLQKGLDRLRELRINTGRCELTREGIEQLVRQVEA
jgi:hypothetical protein